MVIGAYFAPANPEVCPFREPLPGFSTMKFGHSRVFSDDFLGRDRTEVRIVDAPESLAKASPHQEVSGLVIGIGGGHSPDQ